ncbi:unnamed protein product [Laminaria digitata]
MNNTNQGRILDTRLSYAYESDCSDADLLLTTVDYCSTIDTTAAVPQVGETGAGKTSFMKCLAGLESPTTGDITVRRLVYVTRLDLHPRLGRQFLNSNT